VLAQGPLAWHIAVNADRAGFRAVLAELPVKAMSLSRGHEVLARLGFNSAAASASLLVSVLGDEMSEGAQP